MPDQTVTVALANRSPMALAGISAVIDAAPGLTLVAATSDDEGLSTRVLSWEVDVVVIDAGMAESAGLTAAATVRRRHPETRILLLTDGASADRTVRILMVPSDGVLLKSCSGADFVKAVRDIHAGRVVVSPEIAGTVLSAYHRILSSIDASPSHTGVADMPGTGGSGAGSGVWDLLTGREADVLTGVAEARSNTEIADDLGVSVTTVKSHVSNLLRKVGLRDRGRTGGMGLAQRFHDRDRTTHVPAHTPHRRPHPLSSLGMNRGHGFPSRGGRHRPAETPMMRVCIPHLLIHPSPRGVNPCSPAPRPSRPHWLSASTVSP